MSLYWKYDPSAYKVGDPLFIQEPVGWSTYNAKRYEVVKITPGGQIVAKLNAHEIRIAKSGRIVGDDAYRGRRVIDEATAADLRAEQIERAAWIEVRNVAERIAHLARKNGREELDTAVADLSQAVAALPTTAHTKED